MEITYRLCADDFYQAFITHRNRNRFSKWLLRAVVAAVLLIVAFGVLAVLHQRSLESLIQFLPLLAIAVLWGGLFWLYPRWFAHNQFSNQPSAQSERVLDVGSTGVNWQWDGGSATIDWKNMVRFVEGSNLFLLYSSPSCFNIIPKRALSTEQTVELRGLLASHIRTK